MVILIDDHPLDGNLIVGLVLGSAVGIRLGIAAQMGFDPGRQFQRVKRFRHVVVGSRSQSHNLV